MIPPPAQQGAHPREELGEREGLDEVVVGAQLEAAHAILHLVAGGQEQHRRLTTAATQCLQNAPAVQRRQHHVQHDEVVIAVEREVKPIEAVARKVDDKARLGQALAQVVTGLHLVFNDQDLHGLGPTSFAMQAANSAPLGPESMRADRNVMSRSGR